MSTPLYIVNTEIKNTLKNLYSNPEIQELSFIIFNYVAGLSKVTCIAERNHVISNSQLESIKKVLERLLNEEPIEHITGQTDFYGYYFKVTPDVLIPRPETEELVDWIIKTNNVQKPKILDIGTGSGCIAISLDYNIDDAHVFSVDVSKKALAIAKENDSNFETNVQFIEHDILNAQVDILPTNLDILVSNPPYVRESEKALMQKNVLDYEPHTALFVDDDNALIFYEVITKIGTTLLKPNAYLYFEINEALSKGVEDILANYNYKNIETRKDINGKDRMVKAQR